MKMKYGRNVIAVGNSLCVGIPNFIKLAFDVRKGDVLIWEVKKDKITIRKRKENEDDYSRN